MPAVTRAQWSKLPNGELAYTASYTTSGTFFCYGGGLPFRSGSSCQASGNTLTLGNNGAFMTLTLEATTFTATASNVSTFVPVVARITKSFSGTGPFVFPVPQSAGAVSFGFDLDFSGQHGLFGYTLPVDRTVSAVDRNCCGDDVRFPAYFAFGVGAGEPEPYRYTVAVFDRLDGLTITNTAEPVVMTATVGLIPEPAPPALMFGGLAVLGVGAWRRRRTAYWLGSR